MFSFIISCCIYEKEKLLSVISVSSRKKNPSDIRVRSAQERGIASGCMVRNVDKDTERAYASGIIVSSGQKKDLTSGTGVSTIQKGYCFRD